MLILPPYIAGIGKDPGLFYMSDKYRFVVKEEWKEGEWCNVDGGILLKGCCGVNLEIMSGKF